MTRRTRRDFLKTSSVGAVVAATTKAGFATPLAASAAGTTRPAEVTPWVTNNNQKFARGSSLAWKPAAGASEGSIVLNPDKKAQTLLGFGAAFTDAACYTFHQLSAAAREQLFHQLFDTSQMGFSACRTCIGASDYSASLYSFDEGEADPELTRFSIAHDQEYILPVLREARKANPDLFLFSSPWSPPGWMKPNNSMLGGSMQRKYMAAYAQYFLKFLQGYESNGVPVNAITVQNEVDTEQDGKMPACTWPQEYEADFVAKFLGPLFETNRLKTEIWIIDHNYNLWGRALGELETPGVAKYTNSIAWHGYVGQPEWMTRVRQVHPEINMYWTEGGPEYTAPDYATDWVTWSKTFTGILRNGCRSITAWNFALDEHGKPNIGPFNCGGLVTIHSETKQVSYSGQFHAFAHYSRALRRGAYCFDSQGGGANLHHVAFENPNGQRVLILTNSGPATNGQVRLGAWEVSVPVEENSVVTLTWG